MYMLVLYTLSAMAKCGPWNRRLVNAEHYGLQEPSRYAQTTEQSNADKRRLDREGCLSDSLCLKKSGDRERCLGNSVSELCDPTPMKY